MKRFPIWMLFAGLLPFLAEQDTNQPLLHDDAAYFRPGVTARVQLLHRLRKQNN